MRTGIIRADVVLLVRSIGTDPDISVISAAQVPLGKRPFVLDHHCTVE